MSITSMITVLQNAGFVTQESSENKNQVTAGTGYFKTRHGEIMKHCFTVFIGVNSFQAVLSMSGELVEGSTPKALVDKVKEKYSSAGLL